MGLSTLKASVRRLMPETLKRSWWYLTDARWRAAYVAQQRQIAALRNAQRRAFAMIWNQTGGRVAAGPFCGLNYLGEREGGHYTQKLLGTYEKELHPIVDKIVANPYSLIVDIGAAEGYYVCGLAQRMPNVRVKAFEAQHRCHARMRELARRNQLSERIEIQGFCRSADLTAALQNRERTLMVCDVEGAEFELLDPIDTPELYRVDILVEVHEHLRPGVRETLLKRFENTHEIRIIAKASRTLDDIPVEVKLSPDLAMAAMEESRGVDMDWFWMQSREL